MSVSPGASDRVEVAYQIEQRFTRLRLERLNRVSTKFRFDDPTFLVLALRHSALRSSLLRARYGTIVTPWLACRKIITILLARGLRLNFEMPEVLVGNGNTQPWCVLRQIQEAIVRGGIAIEDVVEKLVTDFDVVDREVF
jgi:hypothetical protein